MNQQRNRHPDKSHATITQGQVLEMVTFQSVDGIAEQQFLAAAEASTGALITLPGFLGRRLAKAADGSWVDIVEWRDAASARAASTIFHKLSQAEVFCSMIDMSSVKVTHHQIVTAG